MKITNQFQKGVLHCGVALALGSCGASSSSSDPIAEVPTAEEVEEAAEELIESNSLAAAYPGGLAISVFPQETTSTAILQEKERTKSVQTKKAEAEALLKGDGDNCLAGVFSRTRTLGASVTCYEFDQEMIYGTFNQTLGTKDGTDGSGEACLVAFARSKTTEVEEIVDRGLGLVQGMMCQAKKDGVADALPAVGETLDLATQLTSALGDKVTSVTAATIKRLADQGGRPVFVSSVVLNMADGVTQEMYLAHSPASETDNSSYDGKLWTKVSGLSGANQVGPTKNFLSIQYHQNGTNVQAELLRARIADSLETAAFVNGVLDLNVGADFTGQPGDQGYGQYLDPETNQPVMNSNNYISGMTYIGFNQNVEDGTGTTAYWENPGANYSENARGMVFNLTTDTSGNLVGCGTSGATSNSPTDALSIRKFKKEGGSLTTKGFYHPFFNTQAGGPGQTCTNSQGMDEDGDYYQKACTGGGQPGGSQTAKWYVPVGIDETVKTIFVTNQTGSLISRQCVTQNAEGVYAIDSTQITPAAGYEVIDANAAENASKIVPAPVLTGLVDLTIE